MTHIDLVIELRADKDVQRYVGRAPFVDRAEAELFMQRVIEANAAGTGTCWALSDAESGTPIGTGGVWRMDRTHDIGEIGYSLLPAWWGKGLAARALAPMIDYCFAIHALHRIEANIDPRNARSASLLRKMGFRHEASFRENHKQGDRYLDSHIYGLLASDWPKR